MSYQYSEWEQEPEPQASSSRSGGPPSKVSGVGTIDPPPPSQNPLASIPRARRIDPARGAHSSRKHTVLAAFRATPSPAFSIAYALFSNQKTQYPKHFLDVAHSLPKTPGGSVLVSNQTPQPNNSNRIKTIRKNHPYPFSNQNDWRHPRGGGTPPPIFFHRFRGGPWTAITVVLPTV
jgi:hypothetical protein